MSRDHSTTAWTPDWLGESPGPADEPTNGPAHAAPDLDDETRELIDLDAADLDARLDATDPAEEPSYEEPAYEEPRRAPIREPRRPLVSEGWAEERGRPTSDRPSDPAVGSLRSLSAVAVTGRRAVRPPPPPVRAGRRGGPRAGSTTGLVALVLLALVSAFFAWVTAEPLWLSVGHSQPGAVTVTRCTGDRCLGTFTGTRTDFTREGVPVMGDAPAVGETAPARMTSERGVRAYVDIDPNSRALVGFALILLCGLGIVRATAVRRLPTPSARRSAALLSLGGPLTLLAAMLVVTY